MAAPEPRTYITRDLTTGENILQAGWAKTKSGLLARIEVEGPRITIWRRDGSVDELQKGAFRCTAYRTQAKRRLFVIRTDDGRKIKFLEMTGMLSAAEWDAIADEVLEAVPVDYVIITLRAGAALVIGMLAAAITTGLCAAIFGLRQEQTAFSSPLSLGLMAAWIAALWFGFGRLGWLV